MKHLPKHLRPRWRYLAVELEGWPETAITRREFQRAVWASARALLGDPGSADAVLRVLGFAFEDGAGEATVEVRRGEVEAARAALACVDAVDGQPVRVRVRGTSGTVRACEEKYMGGPPEHREEKQVVFRTAARRASVGDGTVDVDVGGRYAGATRLDLE